VWIVHKEVVLDTRNGKRRWLEVGRKLERQKLISSSFSPDGTLLGSGVWSREDKRSSIQIRDTSSWEVVRTWDSSHIIKYIAFSPDGKWIAGGADGTLTVWEAMTGKVRSTFPFSGETVAWSPDGNYFANGRDLSLHLVGTGPRVFGLGYKGPSLLNFWLFAIIEADLKSFHTRLICAFVGCLHFADHTPSVGST
jgi:WD40 repeat protein